ncbi:MAG: fused MFS/spermidine synthase [Oscillospiraceae bacterium]|nr:fused MFS/spermidine synthase [Oscillospiraceae bacterium]
MKPRNILKNKWYLYVTEFFSGAAVMAVELGANRLLAPYFSSSQIVWTIIIGTIMIAMALGNLWGGRSADKNPNPDKLYARILVAAVWIAAIPALGTSITFLLFSGVLLALGLIYFISGRTKRVLCIFCAAAVAACALFGNADRVAFWEKELLYEGESVYNYLQVKQTGDSVILSTNVLFGVQSIMKKTPEKTGMYYDYALAAPVMTGKAHNDILILGMGTGTYAKQCQYYFDDVTVEGVEIDEKITSLASTYFALSPDTKVTTYDGRAYLGATAQKYDVIMVDAYQDITIPFQMSTTEFFTMVREHLTDNGVMVVNMNMHTEKEGNINAYLADTIAGVFDTVLTVDVPNSTNRELLATQNPQARSTFDARRVTLEDAALAPLMEEISLTMQPYCSTGYQLTDDKAPVELLGMQVIDELIQTQLTDYKDVLKTDGIGGLLRQFT